MELRHEFTVPTGVQEAWDHFQDIASVATCFPGAQVTSVDGDTFSGQVKVKLGPIALVYTGQGEFVEKDASARRFVVDAKGRDKRGNGTAGAKVTLTMTEQAPDSTSVEVLTDLAVTGKPAQFGRGVMQDVSDKLLGQFTQCLERQVQAGGTAAADSGAPGAASAGAGSGSGDALSGAAPDSSSEGTPLAAAAASSSGGLLAAAGAPSVGTGSSSGAGASGSGSGESGSGSGGLLASESAPSVGAEAPASGGSAGSSGVSASSTSSSASSDDDSGDGALDLGATVLPVLAKAYWKQAVGGVVALWVLRRLFR